MSWQLDMAAEMPRYTVPGVSINAMETGRSSLAASRSGMSSVVSGARTLGLMSDDMLGPINKLMAASQLVLGGMMLVNGIRAVIAARAAAESALAAAETALHAAALNWGGIALAGASAASVYAGMQYATGSWTLPSVDLASPIDRARAARQIREVQ